MHDQGKRQDIGNFIHPNCNSRLFDKNDVVRHNMLLWSSSQKICLPSIIVGMVTNIFDFRFAQQKIAAFRQFDKKFIYLEDKRLRTQRLASQIRVCPKYLCSRQTSCSQFNILPNMTINVVHKWIALTGHATMPGAERQGQAS